MEFLLTMKFLKFFSASILPKQNESFIAKKKKSIKMYIYSCRIFISLHLLYPVSFHFFVSLSQVYTSICPTINVIAGLMRITMLFRTCRTECVIAAVHLYIQIFFILLYFIIFFNTFILPLIKNIKL